MLRGEKVVLRAIRREDLQRQWAFNNDVAFEVRGGGDPWEPQSFERLHAHFEQTLSKGERDGASFAIEADGTYIGSCALFRFDGTAHTAELGIGIGDLAYQGRGDGRDAVRVLLDDAFRLCNLRKVWLTVNGDNARAIHAYAAYGFVEEGRLRAQVWSDGHYVDLVYMGLLADEWPTSGRRVADEWPTSGRRVADEWPTSGRRVADEWPTSGRRVADGAITLLAAAPP